MTLKSCITLGKSLCSEPQLLGSSSGTDYYTALVMKLKRQNDFKVPGRLPGTMEVLKLVLAVLPAPFPCPREQIPNGFLSDISAKYWRQVLGRTQFCHQLSDSNNSTVLSPLPQLFRAWHSFWDETQRSRGNLPLPDQRPTALSLPYPGPHHRLLSSEASQWCPECCLPHYAGCSFRGTNRPGS